MHLTGIWWLFYLVVAATALAVAGAGESEEFDAADDDFGDETEEVPVIQPNFTSVAQDFRVNIGDTVRLPCEVDKMDEELVLMWYRNQDEMLFFNKSKGKHYNRISVDGNSLVIRDITPEFHGQYWCLISSDKEMKLIHNVYVLEKPTAAPIPATGFIIVNKGQPVTLSCNVTGYPQPMVTWTRVGGKKFHDGSKTMMGSSITFLDTTSSHSGSYECLAENSEGSPAKASLRVDIRHEPEVSVEETIISTQTGYDVKLTCIVHAEPKAHVNWFKNDGQPIENSTRYRLTNTGSRHDLNIDSVNVDDFGAYTCVGTNKLGKGQQTIQVTAVPRISMLDRKKPLINGVELEWSTFSQTPVTEYRLRFGNSSVGQDQWEKLQLKANAVTEQPFTYKHVHQVHGLHQHQYYLMTIESRNEYGWSQPLTANFTTLGEAKSASISDSSSGSCVGATWWSMATTLVLLTAATLL